ncbi:hypothetical protein [Halothiobacillus diazotrophicus]|uniref:hypothetical protein n=1 Tax=Halothiobacillus diazotrophicus TaxID=1860122 RepID=UPI0009ED4F63|nr:hypothetical protein [Halothiobacillus diazotrophicus]
MKKKLTNLFIFKNKLFTTVVAVPTLISVLYFGFIASDVYVSVSTLVIRTPEHSTPSVLGQFLQGVGFNTSQNDSFTVKDYLTSRDAMNSLISKMNLRQEFENKNIDPFNRFGGLIYWENNLENFYKYYEKKVSTKIDPLSSILTLTTRAYTAKDAYQMNSLLLKQAEGLVNKLNDRAQRDMIGFAEENLTKAENKAKAASLAMGKYRNQFGVINPEKQSAIPLQQIARLQDQLLATKVQIIQIQTLTKNNPQLPTLKERAELLKNEIAQETAKVAGSSDKSLASKAIEYERLSLDNEYAERELMSAMASLQQARTQAQRQHIYIERISEPNTPDSPTEPKRAQGILATLLLSLIVWGILSILNAGVREHYDR